MRYTRIFFFQAEDGIRDQPRSRGLGGVYKGQDVGWIAGIDDRVASIADPQFLDVLPALRHGFGVLSPADRRRLLTALGQNLGDDVLAGRPPPVALELALIHL